jgi:transcriptional regulator of NAD metabolism
MDTSIRRKKIIEAIQKSDTPITGNELSALLNVTRQVVVQDIALLRAGGVTIVATPSGYMMVDAGAAARPMKVFSCRHKTLDAAEEELMIIVENGGKVRDVIIEHPVYGEILGTLMLSTPQAVKNLIRRLKQKNSMMLSSITDGIHMHTVEADSEETLMFIETKLLEADILL